MKVLVRLIVNQREANDTGPTAITAANTCVNQGKSISHILCMSTVQINFDNSENGKAKLVVFSCIFLTMNSRFDLQADKQICTAIFL